MLQPETRRLLTDALRPPSGFHLDAAVATTYSLDLVSLVLAPLAMAAHDAASVSGDVEPDPIALLESVRRHASRMTVFCQAGAVHVPAQYRTVLGFVEDCVVQVVPPAPNRVFHPKIWVLRFEDAARQVRHRFLCLSRNLTMDRSWDTVLQMEESNHGQGADPAPVADFLLDLPSLTPHSLGSDRQGLVESLAASLRGVRLEVPPPFRTAEFWPLGTMSGREWPFPKEAQRLVAVTPFLDAGFLSRMPHSTTWSRLVSRPETFDRLGGKAIPPTMSTWVLQRAAETDDPDEEVPDTHLEVITGLHAKTFVWDAGGTGNAFTGSANGTSAAFGGNVEFSVLLSGPTSAGTASLVGDDAAARGEVGLAKLLQPHEISSPDPAPDPTWQAERALEAFHALLAITGVTVTATAEAEQYGVRVTMPAVAAPAGSTTTVRLLGRRGQALPIDDELEWRDVAARNLSPFVVVETTVAMDGHVVRRACVIKGTLIGGPSDRHRQILRSLLDNEKDLLRYLALLLGDPAFDAMVAGLHEGLTGELGSKQHQTGFHADDLVVFEPLIRAAARRDGSLGRVDSLLSELAGPDGRVPHLSPAFMSLWATVWDAAKELQR